MTDIVNLLDEFYNPTTSPQVHAKLSQALEKWQNSILMSMSTKLEHKLFAAQTLKKKISVDINQLEPQFYITLKDQLLLILGEHGKAFSSPLLIQICLSLVHLSLNLTEHDWPNSLLNLCDILSRFSGGTILLSFLSLFPEEAQVNTSETVHKRAIELIHKNMDAIFYLICQQQKSNEYDSLIAQDSCRCILNWVKYIEKNELGIIAKYSLIKFAYNCLENEESYEVASELFSEIIYRASRNHWTSLFPELVTTVVSLRPLLKESIENEDSERVKSFIYIFCDLTEFFLSDLIRSEEYRPYLYDLLDAILVTVEYGDFRIIEVTFRVWMSLSDLYRDSQADVKPNLQFMINPYIIRLVTSLIHHLKYPRERADWTAQKHDDFRSFRHVIGDCLKDCADIMSIDELIAFLSFQIQSQIKESSDFSSTPISSSDSWTTFEALLTALRLVSVCTSDVSSEPLKQVMSGLSFIYSSSSSEELHYAVVLFISSYAPWTRYHTEYVSLQTEILFSAIGRSPSTVPSGGHSRLNLFSAGCLALKNFCKNISKDMIPFGEYIFNLYQIHESSGSSIDLDLLYESLILIVAHMPVSQTIQVGQDISANLLQKISYLVHLESQDENHIKMMSDMLSRFAIFIETLTGPTETEDSGDYILLMDKVYTFFGELLQITEHIYTKYRSNMSVLESLAKVLKTGFTQVRRELIPNLSQISKLLIFGFRMTHASSVLYNCKTFVKEFSGPESSNAIIEEVIDGINDTIRLSNFTFADDVIEDYYYFISTCLEYFPESITSQDKISWTIIVGLNHIISSTNFNPSQFSIIFSVMNDIYHLLVDVNQLDRIRSHLKPILTQTLFPSTGQPLLVALLMTLFKGLIQSFPPNIIPDLSNLMRTLYLVESNTVSNIFVQVIKSLPSNQFSDYEKDQFTKSIESTFIESRKLVKFLRNLARTCQRRLD